jgi:xyloglucan-specific exo-beta-1,4-glucanase
VKNYASCAISFLAALSVLASGTRLKAQQPCLSQPQCLAQAQAFLVDHSEVGGNVGGNWMYSLDGSYVQLPSSLATRIKYNPWAKNPDSSTFSTAISWNGAEDVYIGKKSPAYVDTSKGFTLMMVYENEWDPANAQNGIALSMMNQGSTPYVFDKGLVFSIGRKGNQWTLGRHIHGVDSTLNNSTYWETPWDPQSLTPHAWEWVYYTFTPDGKVRIDKFQPYSSYYFWTYYDWQETVLDAGYPFAGFPAGTPTTNPAPLHFYTYNSYTTDNGLDDDAHQSYLNPTVPVPGFNRLDIFAIPLSINQMVAYQKNLVDSNYLTFGNMLPCNTGLWMNAGQVSTPCGAAGNGNPPPVTANMLNDGSGGSAGTIDRSDVIVLPPGNVSVVPDSATSVTLSWSASLDPVNSNQVSPSVSSYQVIGGPPSLTTTPAASCTPYTCTLDIGSLTTGQPYTFSIVAVSGAISSQPSSIAGITLTNNNLQPYTWSNVVTGGGGGFIAGIEFNQKQQGLIYARTDIGGAYRWNGTTHSWTPLLDWVSPTDFNTMGVESIATDPVDPNRLYIAAGTYDNYFTNENGAILRSTDQGNTFQRTNLPFKLAGNMPGRGVGERLVIDPNQNGIIYFGATSGSGLWRSTDFGVTWNKVQSFTAVGTYVLDPTSPYGASPIGVDWVAFDPTSGSPGHASQTIYVGVADLGNSLFRSTDGGQTWVPVAGQPIGLIPHHGIIASTGMLYICYSDGAGPYDGSNGSVWKLNISTGAWTNITPLSGNGATYGFSGLSVDAQHPDTVMVTSLNSWWPDANIFRSTDGGNNWARIWDFTGAYPNRTLRYTLDVSAAPWLTQNYLPDPPSPSPKLGWMIESLQIDPFNSDHMLYGTGATLYGTNDLTDWDKGNPIQISVAAAGIEEIAAINLLTPPSGAPLFSMVGDVVGFRHADITQAPTAELPSRSVPPGGLADKLVSLDFAQYYPNFLAATGKVDATQTPAQTGTEFSGNNGVTWTPGATSPAGATGGGTIAVAASPSRVVWSDPGAGVNVSTDKGATWTASSGIPIGAVVASDRNNAMKFYGLSAGTFYVSTDGGLTFTAEQAGLPTNGKYKTVPGREGDIWLSSGNGTTAGLWHSTNSGSSFTHLPYIEAATSVGFGKAASGASYVAIYLGGNVNGVAGFFRSDDGGNSWNQINDNQHQYATTGSCITGDPNVYGRVYVCTNGRGIIKGDIK